MEEGKMESRLDGLGNLGVLSKCECLEGEIGFGRSRVWLGLGEM